MAMDEEAIQKAWNMISQYNDALMIRVAELEEQHRKRSISRLIWMTLKYRFLAFMGRM